MEKISLRANAKINLGLDVLRKREDGYHEVKMIMQSISLSDTLTLTRCPGTGIRLEADSENACPDVPMNEDNLIYKAIRLLKEEFRIQEGVEAVLTKRIPVAAGMAGGSTDAAAALKGMNQLFSLGLSEQELCDRGVRLGADIPYCIMGGTALSEGIGEALTPLPEMPDCRILIAKPPIHVSTAFVYGNLKLQEIKAHPDIDGMIEAIHRHDLHGIACRLGNVLETVTIPAHPVIAEIKDKMMVYGAARSLMSGSGPTVFGIFEQEQGAEQAAEGIRGAGLSEQIYITHPV
ncbi:MAG: 4-(cytidine 5'-diphospho)-2-C-methyl-D-erythritol kinase [Bacteroides sp.]|nr:4-(cytidine 5'-diphospho)-2-C-methyl-D-erythritol kinase [Bacteroides sp.]MCM1550750.1 4-(cytidine 5'-diphospho)-2-C-methyl-D-erythritol kinase [Clostridium sp.]